MAVAAPGYRRRRRRSRSRSSGYRSDRAETALRTVEQREVGLAVAVVISGHRRVVACSPILSRRAVTCCRQHEEPSTGRRAVHRNVGLAVAVVVGGDRYICRQAPCEDQRARVVARRRQDIPGASIGVRARPVHREVRFAVAVVIGRHRNVGGESPGRGDPGRELAARLQDVPGAAGRSLARTIHGDIGSAVAVVVGGDGRVVAEAPRQTHVALIARARFQDVPRAAAARARAEHGGVGLAVAVVVAEHRSVSGCSPRCGLRTGILGTRRRAKPLPGRWTVDAHVGAAVAVEIGRGRAALQDRDGLSGDRDGSRAAAPVERSGQRDGPVADAGSAGADGEPRRVRRRRPRAARSRGHADRLRAGDWTERHRRR